MMRRPECAPPGSSTQWGVRGKEGEGVRGKAGIRVEGALRMARTQNFRPPSVPSWTQRTLRVTPLTAGCCRSCCFVDLGACAILSSTTCCSSHVMLTWVV